MMAKKTPATFLNELCKKYQTTSPIFEYSKESMNFACTVSAFDYHANGKGYSKKKAKHDACSDLLKKLQNTEKYKAEFSIESVFDSLKVHDNYVGILETLCEEKQWPLPSYEHLSTTGNKISQQYTYSVTLASRKCYGVCYCKKTAKQIAAKNLLDSLILSNATFDTKAVNEQLPENVLKSYQNLRANNGATATNGLIKNRHKFFESFPIEIKAKIYNLIFPNQCDDNNNNNENDSRIRNKFEVVDEICKVLGLKYNLLKLDEETLKDCIAFELECPVVDCVLIASKENIFDEIIKYFTVMFNFKKATEVYLE